MDLFSLLGLSSLVGSITGFGASTISNEQANAANLQAVRETNQANMAINQANIDLAKEMYNRQEAYNREIYDDQKAYNSAVAQRQRLEDAGLNPYLMMSGGNAGVATSSTAPSFSVPGQIPMQAGQVRPTIDANNVRQIVNDVSQIGLNNSQQRKIDEEARGLGIQNDYAEQNNKLDILTKLVNIEGLSQDNKGKLIDNYIKQNTADYSVQSAKYDVEYKYQMIRNASMDYMCKSAGLPYISKTAQAELDYLAQQTLTEMQKRSNMRTEQGLTLKQIENVYADTLYKNKQRLNMPNLTKPQCDQLGKALVESATTAVENAGLSGDLMQQSIKFGKDRLNVPEWVRTFGKFNSDYLLPVIQAVQGNASVASKFMK